MSDAHKLLVTYAMLGAQFRTGGQPMSHVKETTLLEYVMAYLQDEMSRGTNERTYELIGTDAENNPEAVKSYLKLLVVDALDAYAGGAR